MWELITCRTRGSDRGQHLFWRCDWSTGLCTSLGRGARISFISIRAMRGTGVRDMRGMSMRRMRGTRAPGLTNIAIAGEEIMFIYVSYSIFNVVGVKAFVSPLHREVAPISKLVARAHCSENVSICELPISLVVEDAAHVGLVEQR
ncbi:hypothetical protein BKA82DRAFT_747972 [Pisolithus tinctorius]|uniref:Uncharacterized protein n=1 Tax=Pisolithus tinctorius Marx 270 TaxID=870435 RepID=A0A0C3KR84_PISTI|nr:hypothetical protein BKA82DRAFT_747972 [Pisolithus tinctorius]KIO12047.1 hypothetical protein M404DRAFT_747972 [Pisolithus tinctorius Marx 270]